MDYLTTGLHKTDTLTWKTTLHLETKSIEFLRAVRNQIHTRDPQNARNPILESVWCHMATPNFTLINSLCYCFDLLELRSWSDAGQAYFVFLLSFWYCPPQKWSTFLNPTNLKSNIKSKQQQRLLIRVKLGVAMGHQTDSRIRFLGFWGSRGCAWFLTAIQLTLMSK